MSENIILETERLYLREISPEDAHWAYELNADPLVIKYTGDDPFESVEEARKFLKGYDHYRRYGFGRWGVMLKNQKQLIGWCGLKYTEEKDEHDLGFRFMRKYWNQGFASESGRACVEFGFDKLSFTRIVGRAMNENIASIKALKNCGMTYVSDFDFSGQPGSVYEIRKKTT